MTHILHDRPLLGLRTPLKLIPEWWLRHIEPKINRVHGSSCWFWDGALNSRGEPISKLYSPKLEKLTPVELKRIVAAMFWDLKDHYEILHGCGAVNCLNPHHFYVTAVAYGQHDRDRILHKTRRVILDADRKRFGTNELTSNG